MISNLRRISMRAALLAAASVTGPMFAGPAAAQTPASADNPANPQDTVTKPTLASPQDGPAPADDPSDIVVTGYRASFEQLDPGQT